MSVAVQEFTQAPATSADVSAKPDLASTTPAALGGAAAVGVGTTAARSDHVHDVSALATAASVALKADALLTLRAHSGTSDTLVLADAGKLVTSNNAAAVAQTIPANASVAYSVGTVIQHLQLGAGQVSFTLTSDTLRVPTGFVAKTRGQYCTVTLTKIASTEWVLSGDLAFV